MATVLGRLSGDGSLDSSSDRKHRRVPPIEVGLVAVSVASGVGSVDPSSAVPPIVVAGMHRSGTSLAASVLAASGMRMGPQLLHADRNNPRGYFEDIELLQLNRSILDRCTSAEHPGHRDWGWTEEGDFDPRPANRFREAASKLLDQRRQAGQAWGWKDPRTSLLLDFWSELASDARFLLVYRFPWDVADSMQRLGADVFLDHPDYALPIWMFYNRKILEFRSRHPQRTILVSIDAVLQRPESLLEVLSDRVELPARPAIEELIDPSLFSQTKGEDPLIRLTAFTSPECVQLLEELDRQADLGSSDLWSVAPAPRRPRDRGRDADPSEVVSVVVPCCDHGQWLVEAVASVERNLAAPYELIIVNDGSSQPRTLEILGRLRQAGYAVLDQPNRGLAEARNRGVREARGAFILPLDSDNRIREGFCEAALAAMAASPRLGVVYGDRYEFGKRSREVPVDDFDLPQILRANYIDACALLRREAWEAAGGYDPGPSPWEDWDLWLTLAGEGWQFRHLATIAYDYRVRPRSLISATAEPQTRQRLLDYLVAKHRCLYERFLPEIVLGALEEISRLRDSLARSSREMVDAESRARARDEELEQLLDESRQAHRRDNEIYEAEVRKLRTLLEEFDAKIYALRDRLEELVGERDCLHAALQHERDNFETEIRRVTALLPQSETEQPEMQRRLEESVAEEGRLHAALQHERERFEAEIQRTKKLLKESEARDRALRVQVADLAGERERLRDAQRQARREFESETQRLTALLAESDGELRRQRELIESTIAERDRFERSYRRERRRLESADAARHRQRQRLELAMSERRKLESRLTTSESRTARVEGMLAAAELEASELRDGLSARELAVRSLDERLRALDQELAETRRNKDWLWEQWQESESRLAALRGSKVGRPLWWIWSGYLGLRRALIRSRAAFLDRLRRIRRLPSAAGAGLRRAGGGLRATGAAVGRLPARWLGGLYLLVHLTGQWTRAQARRIRRRGRRPTMAAPVGARAAGAGIPARPPRVLLLMPYAIYPPNHGGGVRLYNLIQRVADHCELHLLVFSPSGDDPEQREALRPWARRVHFHHWQPRFEPDRWRLQPPNAGLFASDELARRLAHLLATERIDILQLEYTELGQYGLPRFARVKVVLTEHDLAFRQHWRRRKLEFHRRFPEGRAYGSSFTDWLRLARYELAVCRRADQIHVMSEDDGRCLSDFLRDGERRIRVVPNGVDTAYYCPPPDGNRRGVLYLGNFQNLPNVDALEYLMQEIWPLVRTRCPEAGLTVAGAHPSERVTRFHGQQGVSVVGPVPDLRPFYHGHRLMVAPIRAGSGTRLKILEAFASGLPVVSTTLGAEGIAAVPGDQLLIADRPEEFASAVAELLQDEALCGRLSAGGRRLAQARYDWSRSAEAMLQGWHELLIDSAAAATDPTAAGSGSPTARQDASDPAQAAKSGAIDISVIIPTFRGGADLERCLEMVSRQVTDRSVEIVCVDSGAAEEDLESIRRHQARLVSIPAAEFDHGLTRDLGASMSRGAVLVFLNQDAIPGDDRWLDRLTEPLFDHETYAAVQGGIRESSDPANRFFWDSCGDRFYFTRESSRWLTRYFGVGFSTVNAAIRRSVWQQHPFGRAPIMEDKLWQQRVVTAGRVIYPRPQAEVVHTHVYSLRPLWRRCLSEGYGWRLVGERYSLADMTRDCLKPGVHRELLRGLARGRIRSAAELLFPWLRPFALYWGNRWSRGVRL